MEYAPGAPSMCPVQGHAVVGVEGAMAAELRRLRHTGIVLTGFDRSVMPEPKDLRYADWSPQSPPRTPSSRAGGLPSSGSSDSEGRSFPLFKDFLWYPGVLDGRLPAQRAPRPATACRGAPPAAHRDRDPDEEDRREPRRNWAERFNARGRPADDLLLRGQAGMVDRYRHDEGETYSLATWGRSWFRSSPSPARGRHPACRDDEGWEHRRSRSPSVRLRSCNGDAR
ncbi:hypothetical protein C2845_PM07G22830 [Panicum miliaceum]|uniref:Uncharacterized protein n=1 Tax=Panicum miliaceum TaxID=4540 RepID=A0A3L6SNW6_PANMI|nr:hypothetical protein C2845_PM07G22830 [Panicum miliaceum]